MSEQITQQTIYGNQIVLALIADYERNGGLEDGALPLATKKEVLRIRKQLQRRIDNLLTPPAPRTRQPRTRVQVADAPVAVQSVKATFEPSDSYVNSKQRTGKQGRNG